MNSDIFQKWLKKSFDTSTFRIFEKPLSKKYGEFCFYKYIDDPEKDAEIVTASDIKSAIEYFNANDVKDVIVHYGHYFNADYDSLFTLLHYFKNWFNGNILAFCPEEIVFLAIQGNRNVEDVILQLKQEGVTQILGFLPDSISDSKYYADDDELFIDDRHVIFEKLSKSGIFYLYPFNIGQAETDVEFDAMVNFIVENNLSEIILQPAKLIDTERLFDYDQGQAVMMHLGFSYYIPQRALKIPIKSFSDKSFEICFKFNHI